MTSLLSKRRYVLHCLKFFCVSLLLFWASSPAVSQTPAEIFGTLDEVWDASISPDGSNVALGCSPTGVKSVCIYSMDSDARPKLINPPKDARITGLFWTSNQYLIYSIEVFEKITVSSGLREFEINRLVSYDLDTGESQILMRNIPAIYGGDRIDSLLLGDDDEFLTSLTLIADDKPKTGRLVAQKGQLQHVVYKVNLKTGKAKVQETKQRSVLGSAYDAYGKEIATIEWDLGNKRFRVTAPERGRKVLYEAKAETQPLSISGLGHDGDSLIVNFDDESRFGLYEMQLSDGAVTPVTYNGEAVGNLGVIEDRYTNEIIGYRFTNDLPGRWYTDPEFASVAENTQKVLNADSVILTSWSQDRKLFTIAAVNKGRPTSYYLFDVDQSSISALGGQAPWLDGQTLGQISEFSYTARDGMKLYGYLVAPPGQEDLASPLPMVVLPHGGPEARDDATYNWLSQAIAGQGYLVLKPNFRGSAGYGQDYRNAGYDEFGGKMVDDVVDAADWAISQGFAQSEYCVVGWSYGGYSALMTTLKAKSKVTCTVSINGVTDPGILFTDTYRDGPGFAYWENYVGDFFQNEEKRRSEINPFARSAEFVKPVLLIHGDEDLIVPIRQSEKMAEALGSLSRFVELNGDDHNLETTVSRQKLLSELFDFLETHHVSN